MILNEIIIAVANVKVAEAVVEILKGQGVKMFSRDELRVVCTPEQNAYIIYNKLCKIDNKERSIAVYKDRKVVDGMDFITSYDKDYFKNKIEKDLKDASNTFVNIFGGINIVKPKAVLVKNVSEIKAVCKSAGVKYSPEYKGLFPVYVCIGSDEKIKYSNDFDANYVSTKFEYIKDVINIDRLKTGDMPISIDMLRKNDTAFLPQTDAETIFLLETLESMGFKWISSLAPTVHNFGPNVYYSTYVSKGGHLLLFFTEEVGDDCQVVKVGSLMERAKDKKKADKKDVKDGAAKAMDKVKAAPLPVGAEIEGDVAEEEAAIEAAKGKKSRIVALKTRFPREFGEIKTAGFRFSTCNNELRLVIAAKLRATYGAACIAENYREMTIEDLSNAIIRAIDSYIINA